MLTSSSGCTVLVVVVSYTQISDSKSLREYEQKLRNDVVVSHLKQNRFLLLRSKIC